ncbi:hypothetical protein MNBD_GAMMA22-2904 [hydrothermal vent metagenome]|uniref:RDD domain-containing protein n=1 Tax=hydrothermal vent metagenome TaxID=652676 RepID=A0A3B1A1V4_9ZZZZ
MSEQNPYQPPTTEVGNGEALSSTGPELASPWIRLLAAIIDMLILMIFVLPLQFMMGVYDGFPEKMQQPDLQTTLLTAGVAILFYIAINAFTLHRNAQTIGKLICKIKIVRVDFSKATFSRIIFRRYLPITFVSQVPIGGAIISLIDVLMIFRKTRQCLHDNIAETVVIKA